MSAPRDRSLTAFVKLLTTLKLTSASSSARRISRIAAATSSSVSVPRPRTSASVDWSFSASESNIRGLGLSLAWVGRRAVAPTRRERPRDPSERLRELGRDHEHLVGIPPRELRQHLQVLVAQQLPVGLAVMDRLEYP